MLVLVLWPPSTGRDVSAGPPGPGATVTDSESAADSGKTHCCGRRGTVTVTAGPVIRVMTQPESQ